MPIKEALTERLGQLPTIKPVRSHHVFRTQEGRMFFDPNFISALVHRRVDQEELIIHVGGIARNPDKDYVRDFFGENSDGFNTIYEMTTGYQKHYREIADLRDDDILSIGIVKDGICDTCAIGSHCIRRDWPGIADPVESEPLIADFILTAIKGRNPNLEEGVDYEWVVEQIPLMLNGKIEMTEVKQLYLRVGSFRGVFRPRSSTYSY